MIDTPTPVPAASERMTAEQMRELLAFDVGDPSTWPEAETITAAASRIQSLERELAASKKAVRRAEAAERELMGEALDRAHWHERALAAEARAETARATAIEEAAQAVVKLFIVASTSTDFAYNAALHEAGKAIRALLTAPPPTAKDRTDG